MTTLLQIFLFEMKRLIVCNTELFLYQVNTYNFFCNRMFYLKTSIHFKEIEIAVLVNKEFNCSCSLIIYSLGSRYSSLTHFLA